MKKLLALLVAALLIVCASLALAEPVAIKALILPKFESGEMAGDFPGEAQYYYEGYCEGGESYDIVGLPEPAVRQGRRRPLRDRHGQGQQRDDPSGHPDG